MTRDARLYYLMTLIGWTFTILFLLLRKSTGEVDWFSQVPHFDKVVHFTLFLIWSALCCLSFSKKKLSSRSLVYFLMVIFFFAGITEFLQKFVEGRSPDMMDFWADTVGGFLGLIGTNFLKLDQ